MCLNPVRLSHRLLPFLCDRVTSYRETEFFGGASRKLGQACTHIGVQLLLAVDELRSVKSRWMGAKNHQLMPYWITRSISAIDSEVDDRLIDAAGRSPKCKKSSAVR